MPSTFVRHEDFRYFKWSRKSNFWRCNNHQQCFISFIIPQNLYDHSYTNWKKYPHVKVTQKDFLWMFTKIVHLLEKKQKNKKNMKEIFSCWQNWKYSFVFIYSLICWRSFVLHVPTNKIISVPVLPIYQIISLTAF